MKILSTKIDNKNHLILEWSENNKIAHAKLLLPESLQDGSIIDLGGGVEPYTLPTATATRLGGIKVGEGLVIDENGELSVSGAPVDKKLISISAITSKTVYNVGETVDERDFTVTGIYNDGSTEILGTDEFNVSPTILREETEAQVITITETKSGFGHTATVTVKVVDTSGYSYIVVKHNFINDYKAFPAEPGTVQYTGAMAVDDGATLYTWDEIAAMGEVKHASIPTSEDIYECGDGITKYTSTALFIEKARDAKATKLEFLGATGWIPLIENFDWGKQAATATFDGKEYNVYCFQTMGEVNFLWRWYVGKVD